MEKKIQNQELEATQAPVPDDTIIEVSGVSMEFFTRDEKIDNLKNMTLPNAPLSPDGTPIAVMKRREVVTEPAEDYRRQPVERQDEASVLADRERARLMNEEMIRQSRSGENARRLRKVGKERIVFRLWDSNWRC